VVQVQINAAKCDQGTAHIAEIIAPTLEALSQRLSGDYGGPMEHLWIDLELCPADADRRPPRAFRFQKRVAPPRVLAAFEPVHSLNVGHYSVRPDYFALAQVDLEWVPAYIAKILYDSTETLIGRRTLRHFDVDLFRARFARALKELGLTAPRQSDN
jgi:hypothetical protein